MSKKKKKKNSQGPNKGPQVKAAPPKEEPKPAEAPAKKRLDGRLILEIGMGVALIVLMALLLFRPGKSTEASQDPEITTVTVRFHSPEGTEEQQLEPGDTLTLEDGAAIDGYTFLRWRDAEGQTVTHRSFRVWDDADFYAVYAMALGTEEHEPYLSLDEDGAFHPNGSLTRREVVCILYDMLDTKLVGDGVFLDLDKEDEAYKAAATLKQLGVLPGSRFHPDETITRQEFLEILCGFFPDGTEKAVFSDLDDNSPIYPIFCTAAQQGWIESGKNVAARPDDELTRIEFVCILNQVLNRHGDALQRKQMVGTILDMSSKDPRFWEAAEAAVVHKHRGDGAEEHWTRSEALPMREEGFFFLGSRLHVIGPDGDPVVNDEYQGLYFDENGVESSGLPELDEQIWALMDTLVKPETMKQEDMLRILYNYVVLRSNYRMGNYYQVGEPSGWEAQEALSLLTTKRGNCYSFAALFYELARAIGYDATAYAGCVIGDSRGEAKDVRGDPVVLPLGHCPHGWVEIEFDGVAYIFDPEYAYLHRLSGTTGNFYKIGGPDRTRYGYISDLNDVPAKETETAPKADGTAPQTGPTPPKAEETPSPTVEPSPEPEETTPPTSTPSPKP